MERDEVETLATLSSLRLIFDGLIAGHRGRITNTAGDSVLAEFQSVVDALDCAVKVQQELLLAGENLDPEKRLNFRIGINVGDVMVKDGDIFGDGVNIAARLESLAAPGGICVSRGVRDHVRKMNQYAFEDLGEQIAKNIAQPIRAFRLRLGQEEWVEPAVAGLVSTVSAAPEPAAGGEAAFELTFWDAIKESKDPAEFAAYLERYPKGAFAALAETRRQALIDAETAPPPSAAEIEPVSVELAFWDTVKDSDNPAMYAAYLEQYPEGSFAALAKVRLEELPPPAP